MSKKTKRKPKRYTKRKIKKESKAAPILEKAVFILLLVIIFYPVYLRGMYFETEQLWLEMFVFILFAAFWVYRYLKKEEAFLENAIDYAALGLVAAYLLSLLAAVSLRLAVSELLKYCMYFSVFYMLSRTATTAKRRMLVLWVILASAAGVCILGLDGAAGEGVANALNGFFKKALGLEHNVFFGLYVGNRINSTVQYPNALAGYLAAVFFSGMALMLLSKKLWQQALAGALQFLVATVFFFTLSRGGFMVMAGALLLYLVVLPKGSRIRGAVYAAAPLAATGIILVKMYGYITYGVTNRIWLAAAAGMVLSSLFTILAVRISHWFERISWKVYAVLISVAVIITAAGLIFVLSATQPVTLAHGEENDKWLAQRESIKLKPGEYTLELEVEAKNTLDKPYAYLVRVFSRNMENILGGGSTELCRLSEKATEGLQKKSIDFTVPEDSEITDIDIRNYYAGTSATFDNVQIIDAQTGRTVKKVALGYKYIPKSIQTDVISRFENMEASKSSISRNIFYRDGMRMLGDRWALGGGGGAWSVLYFSYQSYMYWSKQAHNFWLQTAIETGIPGMLALLFLLFGLVAMYIRQAVSKADTERKIMQAVLLTAVMALLVHSIIDFDLSLAGISLLMWQLLALFAAGYNVEGGKHSLDRIALPGKARTKPVVMAVIAVLLLVLPVMFKYAELNARNGLEAYNEGEREKGMAMLERAIKADPVRPHYKVDYANMLTEKTHTTEDLKKAVRLAMKAADQSWYDADLLSKITGFYLKSGVIDGGLSTIDRALELRPLWEGSWHQKAAAYYRAAIYAIQRQDRNSAGKMLDTVLTIPEQAREANKNSLAPFTLGIKAMEIVEKCALIKENLDSGKTFTLDDITFYSRPYMDLDFDGIPDRWRPGNEETSVYISGDVLTAEYKGENSGYIQSRELNLEKGRKYTVEIKLAEEADKTEINYIMTGVQGKWQPAVKKDDIYTAEFETPGDLSDGKKYLRIRVEDRINIESILVMAEEE